MAVFPRFGCSRLERNPCLCLTPKGKTKINKRELEPSRVVRKFQNVIHVGVLAPKALILKPLNAHKCTIFTQGRINLMFLAGLTPFRSLHFKWMLQGLIFRALPHRGVHTLTKAHHGVLNHFSTLQGVPVTGSSLTADWRTPRALF